MQMAEQEKRHCPYKLCGCPDPLCRAFDRQTGECIIMEVFHTIRTRQLMGDDSEPTDLLRKISQNVQRLVDRGVGQ